MPIISSYASASSRGFSAQTTVSTPAPPDATYYYVNGLSTGGTAAGPSNAFVIDRLINANNTIYSVGQGSNDRPYCVSYTGTGALSTYKVWSLALYSIIDVKVDTGGNTHILAKYISPFTTTPVFRLLKYDNSGIQVYAKSYTYPAGSYEQATFGLGIDSSNNLYVGTVYGTNVSIIKIDSATYNITWAKTASVLKGGGGLQAYTFRLHTDSAGNCYVTGRNYSGTPLIYGYAMKFDSAGAFSWGKSYEFPYGSFITPASAYDANTDTLYFSLASKLISLSSSGTTNYTHTMPLNAGTGSADSAFADICINSLGNIVYTCNGTLGLYVACMSTSSTLGSTIVQSQININNNYEAISIKSDSYNTYVLVTQSTANPIIIKLSPNGSPPSTGGSFSFPLSNGTISGTISIISNTNSAVSNTTLTSAVITGSTSDVTITVASVTMNATITPVAYSQQIT